MKKIAPLPHPLKIGRWLRDSGAPQIEISGEEDPYWIAGVGSPSHEPEQALAYAKQIVRECNTYSRLVQIIRDLADDIGECRCKNTAIELCSFCEAQALLRELGGEVPGK